MNVEVEEVTGNGCISHGKAVGRVKICKCSEHKICFGGHGAKKKGEKNEKKKVKYKLRRGTRMTIWAGRRIYAHRVGRKARKIKKQTER